MRQTEQQVTHIHQPSAWPVPNACAQSYHPGSGSHDSCFTLIKAHQHGMAVGPMNEQSRVFCCCRCFEAGAHKGVQCCAAHQHTKHTRPQHCTSSTVHYISPQDGCTSTPNIAGVMSHVRHPLLNYTTSPIPTAHKDKLKNAGGLTKPTNYSAIAKRPH